MVEYFGCDMIEIIDVKKSYKNKNVLNGVSFNILDGEIKGMIGVNGAGKSTLIEIICGVKKMDAGKIVINGIDIKDRAKKKNIQNSIGYMPQNFSLFNDLTVRENLEYLCAVYGKNKARVDELMEMCQIKDYAKMLAKNLSGGYRQLLSMAGAIIHAPKFLILDEPTAAMDPIFRRKFWQIVHKIRGKDVSVLIITHYMEELVECDNFVCLSGGLITFNGNLNQFNGSKLDIEQILNKSGKINEQI